MIWRQEQPAVDADWSFSGTAYDYLGWSLRIADVNQDGVDDVVAGVIFEDFPSLGDAGALYAFYGSEAGVLSSEPDFIYQGRDRGWHVGETFAIVDDVDGDGLGESIVYASRSQRFARDVGSVEWLPSSLMEGETLADADAFRYPILSGDNDLGRGSTSLVTSMATVSKTLSLWLRWQPTKMLEIVQAWHGFTLGTALG